MRKLYVRVYMYFMVIVAVFSILMAILFMHLYESNTKESYYNLLSNQAQAIADRMSRYVLTNDVEDFIVYMEMLEDSVSADVWIFSNEMAYEPMNPELVNIQLTDEELTKENKYVLQQAFLGRMASKTGYSEIHEMLAMTVGTPIYNMSDEVVGAVLLIAPVESQETTMNSIMFLFGISILVALAVCIVLAIVFTRKLSYPIMRIKATTSKLAKGDYNAKTKICEKNEIGELAESVDILADRLQENERDRAYIDQMRKDFFSNISHELRTPVTVIRAYVESLVDGVVSEEKIPQYYERMLNECTGMQRLIQDLLLLSKVENPDFEIHKEPVNVIQVFDDIIRSVRVVCADKKLQLQLEADKECCFINADYDRIRQVFFAVIDNAIKFSNLGGTIYIKIRSVDKIRIEIRDQGIGMEEEELDHIFDKFYTKKSPANKNGSGLGLVIAKEIIKKHNGSIYVESQKGVGTAFTFEFEQLFLDEEFE